MNVSNLLRSFTTKLAPSSEIERIREQQPGVSRKIEAHLAACRKISQEEASPEELQGQLQLWQDLQRQTAICLLLISLFHCVSKLQNERDAATAILSVHETEGG